MQRAAFDLAGIAADSRRPAAVAVAGELADRPLSAAARLRGARRSGSPARRTTRSSASRATASTRSRSDPCTRASSSPGTSASRSSARRCCGSKSDWATSTRASRSASSRMPLAEGHRLAGRVSGDSTVAYAWAYAQALEAIAGARGPAARAVAARAGARARAHRESPGRSRLSRQRRRLRVRPRAVLAPQGGRAAHERRAVRPPAAMDYVVPGGVARDLAPEARGGDARRMRRRSSARSARCATSTTSTPGLQDRFRTCGIVTPALARAARPDRPRRARQRAGVRPALRLSRRAVRRARACARRRAPTATSPRASRCASTRSLESLRLVRAIVDAHARRRHRAPTSPPPPAFRLGLGYVEGWRGPVLVALESGPGRHDPPLPSARSVVAELAGARARGDRQHRSGLSADQQVVQPFVQRARPLRPCSTS